MLCLLIQLLGWKTWLPRTYKQLLLKTLVVVALVLDCVPALVTLDAVVVPMNVLEVVVQIVLVNVN